MSRAFIFKMLHARHCFRELKRIGNNVQRRHEGSGLKGDRSSQIRITARSSICVRLTENHFTEISTYHSNILMQWRQQSNWRTLIRIGELLRKRSQVLIEIIGSHLPSRSQFLNSLIQILNISWANYDSQAWLTVRA
jgi:hypothetical protein